MDSSLIDLRPVHSDHSCRGLSPTTSRDSGRYEKVARVQPSPTSVGVGRKTTPGYLPSEWALLVHPEGQRYFCRTGGIVVVTESNVYVRDVLEAIQWHSKFIEDCLRQRKIDLTPDIELYIHVGEDECLYYLVQHSSRTQFWIEDDLETQQLNLLPVVSDSHLDTSLESLYWLHVEYFPMHVKIHPDFINELECVFLHAICDQMTSTVSTFPYSRHDSMQFAKLLKNAKRHALDGRTTTVVARLWYMISEHRFMIHYGEESARLSRDQSILYNEYEHQYRSWPSRAARLFCFGTYDSYLQSLDDLFVDQFVYLDPWKAFVTTNIKRWQQTTLSSSIVLLLHILLYTIQGSPILAVISAFLLCCSLITSTLLTHHYEPLENCSASDAFNHLDAVRSDRYGFQFMALALSIPKTTYLWALGFVFANGFYVIARDVNRNLALGLSCMSLLALMTFCKLITSGVRFHLPHILRKPRKETAEDMA